MQPGFYTENYRFGFLIQKYQRYMRYQNKWKAVTELGIKIGKQIKQCCILNLELPLPSILLFYNTLYASMIRNWMILIRNWLSPKKSPWDTFVNLRAERTAYTQYLCSKALYWINFTQIRRNSDQHFNILHLKLIWEISKTPRNFQTFSAWTRETKTNHQDK